MPFLVGVNGYSNVGASYHRGQMLSSRQYEGGLHLFHLIGSVS